MITRFVKLVSLFVMLSAACLAQSGFTVVSTKPPHGIPVKNAGATPAFQDSTVDNGIEYQGGPVMNKPSGTNVYFIWYGNWSGDSTKQILPDFVRHLGGSPYFNINTTYYDYGPQGQQDPVFNKVNFVTGVDDNYTLGTSLTDNDVGTLMLNHLGVDLPVDTNGVYYVMTSADVTEQEFCWNFCAWHAYLKATNGVQTLDFLVAWVGNPKLQCSANCGVQDPSPNNNPGADSMATFVAHELQESVTDPYINAWYDVNGNENADKCVWTFGCSFTGNGNSFSGGPACGQTSNGAYYNMKLGARDYMIQRNWVNANGGYCALKWGD